MRGAILYFQGISLILDNDIEVDGSRPIQPGILGYPTNFWVVDLSKDVIITSLVDYGSSSSYVNVRIEGSERVSDLIVIIWCHALSDGIEVSCQEGL